MDGVKMRRVEVWNDENPGIPKWSVPMCRNHNIALAWSKEHEAKIQVEKIVALINNKELTVKRKTKYFLENKDLLGITKY